MRKVSAVSLAAFYLLLTTGIYVCLLHCTAEYFLGSSVVMADHDDDHDDHDESAALPLDQTHSNPASHHTEKKPCKGGDCDCCNKHGSYAVKENLSTSVDFNLIAIASNTPSFNYHLDSPSTGFPVAINSWPYPNGPPLLYKQPHYILNRSLLI